MEELFFSGSHVWQLVRSVARHALLSRGQQAPLNPPKRLSDPQGAFQPRKERGAPGLSTDHSGLGASQRTCLIECCRGGVCTADMCCGECPGDTSDSGEPMPSGEGSASERGLLRIW